MLVFSWAGFSQVFQTLHDYEVYQALHVHASFDDLDHMSKSLVIRHVRASGHQNGKTTSCIFPRKFLSNEILLCAVVKLDMITSCKQLYVTGLYNI